MSYLPYEPQQQSLLPQALQDWLPEGHLAYFIRVAIDSLDLRTFYARYEGGGSRNQPFHPRQHLTNRSLGAHPARTHRRRTPARRSCWSPLQEGV